MIVYSSYEFDCSQPWIHRPNWSPSTCELQYITFHLCWTRILSNAPAHYLFVRSIFAVTLTATLFNHSFIPRFLSTFALCLFPPFIARWNLYVLEVTFDPAEVSLKKIEEYWKCPFLRTDQIKWVILRDKRLKSRDTYCSFRDHFGFSRITSKRQISHF